MERKEKMTYTFLTIIMFTWVIGVSIVVGTKIKESQFQYGVKLESTGNCKVYSEGKKVGEGNLFEGFSIDSLIKNDNR